MIRSIQYLRALAAISVVWLHALMVPGFTDELGRPRFHSSGVDLFFVISGFIMLITTHGKDVTPGEFFGHRIVRVVPMYWLGTFAMAACIATGVMSGERVTAGRLAQSLMFIPMVNPPILFPGWTLNYEMFFYSLFALSLAIPQRLRLGAFLSAMIALVVAGYAFKPGAPVPQAYTSPLLLEFAGGSVIAYLWLTDRLKIGLPVSLAAIAVGFFLLFRWNEPPFYAKTQMLGSFLVVSGCLHPMLRAWRSSVFLALGDASYSIYLTHPLILAALGAVWLRLFPRVSFTSALAFMVIAILTSGAIGWLCCRFVEKPMTDRLRRLTKLKSLAVVPAVAAVS